MVHCTWYMAFNIVNVHRVQSIKCTCDKWIERQRTNERTYDALWSNRIIWHFLLVSLVRLWWFYTYNMRRLQKPTTCCSNVNYVVISLKAYVSVAVLFEMEFLFGNHYLLGVVVAAITVIVSNYSSCGAFWCPLKLYFLWFLFAQFRYVALFFLFPFTFSFFCSFGIRKRFFGVWFRFSAVIHTQIRIHSLRTMHVSSYVAICDVNNLL